MITSADNLRLIDQALSDIAPFLIGDLDGAPGLLNGLAGRALTLWFMHKHDPALVDESRFDALLEKLQSHTQKLQRDTSFGYGLTGVAWLFEYLLQEQQDYDPGFNHSVDELLVHLTARDTWEGEIEYVLGLAGIAVYAARRRRRGQGGELYANIGRLMDRMAETVEKSSLRWKTPDSSQFRMGEDPDAVEYNLGLAHGIPSMVAALIPAIGDECDDGWAERLVAGACNWILDQKQDVNQVGSYFGYVADDQRRSRLGWCYGDLSIALALIRAGQAVGEPRFIDQGIEIARHAAGRDVASSAVADAGICHGSAGLYLLFHLIDARVSDEHCATAARRWLSYTLELYRQSGISGFDRYLPAKDADSGGGTYVAETGLLTGYAGVALCLITAAGAAPDWMDGILLG